MNDVNRSSIPPQGDKFEDQYTSATADLSAGGVATAGEIGATASNATYAVGERAGNAAATAPEAWTSASSSARDANTQPWSAGGTVNIDSTDGQRGMLPNRRTMGLGGTVIVAVAGGIGGAWAYQRWQRERSKPINRLRRGALGIAGRIGERMPETDLPAGTAPLGGAGAAILLSSLLIARAMRHEHTPAIETRVEQSRGVVHTAIGFGRQEAMRRLRVVILEKVLEEARKRGKDLPGAVAHMPEETKKRGGIGLSGMLLIGGIGFVLVRMLRGGRSHAPAM